MVTACAWIVLDLLDKAILERPIPTDANPRALEVNNAQGFIALGIRRILSEEFTEIPDHSKDREIAWQR